jgi:hypothetical protein
VPGQGVAADGHQQRLSDLAPDQGGGTCTGIGEGDGGAQVADPVGPQLCEGEVAEPQLPLQQPPGHRTDPAEDESDREQLEVGRVGRQADQRPQNRCQEEEDAGQQDAEQRRQVECGRDVGPLEPARLHDGRTDAELADHDREAHHDRGRDGDTELLDGDQARQHHDRDELEDRLPQRRQHRPGQAPDGTAGHAPDRRLLRRWGPLPSGRHPDAAERRRSTLTTAPRTALRADFAEKRSPSRAAVRSPLRSQPRTSPTSATAAIGASGRGPDSSMRGGSPETMGLNTVIEGALPELTPSGVSTPGRPSA